MIDQGKTHDEIIQAFIAKYGGAPKLPGKAKVKGKQKQKA